MRLASEVAREVNGPVVQGVGVVNESCDSREEPPMNANGRKSGEAFRFCGDAIRVHWRSFAVDRYSYEESVPQITKYAILRDPFIHITGSRRLAPNA
jgi:hypothetical protein